MKVLDLFSGIGGFSLGLEAAGMKTVAFCEVEKWCCAVLKKNWPKVPNLGDITQILSVVVSPARTSAWGAAAPASPVPVLAYGNTYAKPFAWYDRPTQSWRTWQRCSDGEWELYSETWPRSGMTRNGIAYRLPDLVPYTKGTGYGLSATPTAVMPVTRQSCNHITLKSGRPRKVLKTGKTCSMNWAQEMLHNGLVPTPKLCEFWMGFPIGHTDLKHLEIPSTRKFPKSSVKQ